MTDLKFLILEHLYKNGRSELFPNFYELNPEDDDAVFYALQELASIRLIKIAPNYDVVFLTPSGAAAYEEAEETRKNQAQNKKQQCFDNKIAIASVFISLISFVSGVVVEANLDVWRWFISLFH